MRHAFSRRPLTALLAAALCTLGTASPAVAATSAEDSSASVAAQTGTDLNIVTQPASRNVAAGDPVSFTVVATGDGTLSYQWRKDGIAIADATAATYTIPAASGSHFGTYSVLVTNTTGSLASADATLAIFAQAIAPGITTQPASQTVNAGTPASFTVVATGDAPLTYQWQQQLLGTFTNIAGATSSTYTVANPQTAGSSSYRVVVSNNDGQLASNTATLTVTARYSTSVSDGYAASATGGGTLSAVTVTTATAFRAQAESSTAAVITVSGSLNLGSTKVSVKSNKTIQGANADATLVGNLELASDVSNVVIRGLNITNPAGTDGISITGARNVFIAHCTVFDCGDGLIDITAAADNITVAWCEFYYSAAQNNHRYAMQIGAPTGETTPLRVTLHHNLWSDRADRFLPASTYGRVHMYNNLLDLSGNTAGTAILANAELLSERNSYRTLANPLAKSSGGLIRTLENNYAATTGTAPDAGTDTVFTPTYSYRTLPITGTNGIDVGTVVLAHAGNTAGLDSQAITPLSASITGPTSSTAGASVTLTADATGFAPASYQWRLNNAPISGATSATYNASQSTASTYTVAIKLSNDEVVVSSPHTLTVQSGGGVGTPGGGLHVPREQPAGSSSGGGGSPSLAYLAALLSLATFRALRSAKK